MTSLDEGTERSEMICMMSVPAKMAIHDLLQFTAACYPDIERMRIIRDSTPNQYMVLVKFKTQVGGRGERRSGDGWIDSLLLSSIISSLCLVSRAPKLARPYSLRMTTLLLCNLVWREVS